MQVWENFTITTDANCGCCGGGGESCFLTAPTLLIEGTSTPYANITEATDAVSNQSANGCYAWGSQSGDGNRTRTSFNSSFTAGELQVDTNCSYAFVVQDDIAMRIYLNATDGLNVAYNLAGGDTQALFLWEDDQSTLVDGVVGTSGVWTPTIPSDNYCWLTSEITGDGASSSIALSCNGGSAFLPCSVRAAYGNAPDYVICA